MSDPHIIRLRAPWEATLLPDGRTDFRRRFGCPRRTDRSATIWLISDSLPEDAELLLNGDSIESGASEVGLWLRPRNELSIVMVAEDPPEHIYLEIRSDH